MDFEHAMELNRAAIEHATVPNLRKLLPVLRQAERETAVAIGKWLHQTGPSVPYDIHQHRALLAQLHQTIAILESNPKIAIYDDAKAGGDHVLEVSMNRLSRMIASGAETFEGAIRPLRLDVASVMGESRKLAHQRFARSARTYSKAVNDDIRNRLMLGVVRGETVDQLTSRLLQSTGLIRMYKAQGLAAIGEGVSGKMFGTYRRWAEATVRTDLIDAYGEVAMRGIEEANKEDPGWLKEWDAAADMRVCVRCAELDHVRLEPHEVFKGGVVHPPLHRCCRCVVVPVRADWTTHNNGGVTK